MSQSLGRRGSEAHKKKGGASGENLFGRGKGSRMMRRTLEIFLPQGKGKKKKTGRMFFCAYEKGSGAAKGLPPPSTIATESR